ncbi:hypothetical protein EJ08DRAFT_481018 [Tothia fuscella]|uniref:Uncharacterized protein n=1 Tax=Tothia fuscella TaxID=1048955 RepID=A0A9P4NHZ6_9PEZI|nr:hypothetical protein EJ08DRAFT_481018 [Tothia fuscella]
MVDAVYSTVCSVPVVLLRFCIIPTVLLRFCIIPTVLTRFCIIPTVFTRFCIIPIVLTWFCTKSSWTSENENRSRTSSLLLLWSTLSDFSECSSKNPFWGLSLEERLLWLLLVYMYLIYLAKGGVFSG